MSNDLPLPVVKLKYISDMAKLWPVSRMRSGKDFLQSLL